MAKTAPKAPPEVVEFLKATKRRLLHLDADGWCVELNVLHQYSVDLNLGLHSDDPKTLMLAEEGREDKALLVQRSVPTVEFVGPNKDGYHISAERLPALIIDGTATDSDIMEQVRLALAERKKSNPPPVSKRGRQAPNFRFDAATFSKWRAEKIVELGCLLAWRAKLPETERSIYPDWVFGEWLGFAESRGGGSLAKKTAAAKKTLREALACRPALVAQIAQDSELAVPGDAIISALLGGLRRNEDGEPEIVLPRNFVIAKRIDTGS